MSSEQLGFDFEDKDLKEARLKNQKIIDEHNAQYFKKTEEKWINVDLKKLLDQKGAQENAMLYIRMLLNKALRNCHSSGRVLNKADFIQLLAHEVRMKSINRTLALELIDYLMKK